MEKMISVVIPCYRSQDTLTVVVDQLAETLNQRKAEYDFEILLVNDCSPDKTQCVIENLCQKYSFVKGIELAKNFGQQAALMAGFSAVKGNIIVCLDDDGQTDPTCIFSLIDALDKNTDLVFAEYDEKQHTAFRNLGTKVNNYMAEKLIGKPKGLNFSSYFACKRYIVDNVQKYRNPYPYVAGLLIASTSKIGTVPIHHKQRLSGSSGYTFKKLFSLWLNGFTSFSVKPLRISTAMGAFMAICGFLYSIVIIIRKLTSPLVVVGWSSMICTQMIVGGMVLLMLGMVGEYIGRLYISSNNIPQYVIRKDNNFHADGTKKEEGDSL